VGKLPARPPDAVASAPYATKPEVFQVDWLSRLPRSQLAQE